MDNVTTELFEVIMKVDGKEDATKAVEGLTKLLEILKIELKDNDSEYLKRIALEVEAANKDFQKLTSNAKKLASSLKAIASVDFNNIAGIKNLRLDDTFLNRDLTNRQMAINVELKTAEAKNKLESFLQLLLKRGEITEERYNSLMDKIGRESVKMGEKIKKSLSFDEPMRKLSSSLLGAKDNILSATGLMDKGFLKIKQSLKDFQMQDSFNTIKNSMLDFIEVQEKAGNHKFTKYKKELKDVKFNIDEVNKALKNMNQLKLDKVALDKYFKDYQKNLSAVSGLSVKDMPNLTSTIDNAVLAKSNEQFEKMKASLIAVNEEMFMTGKIGYNEFLRIENQIKKTNNAITQTTIKEDNLRNALTGINNSPLSGITNSFKFFGVELNKNKRIIDSLTLDLNLKKEREEMLKNITVLKEYGKIGSWRFNQLKNSIDNSTLSMGKFGRAMSGTMTKLGELSSTTRALFVNLTRAFIAIQVGKSVLDWTDKVEKLNNAIFQLKQFHGYEDIEGQLNSLNNVTGGILDKYTIIQATNKAIDLGVDLTNGKLLKLSRMVSIIGQKYGVDSKKMFEDFTVALGKANPIVLDNIGIILKKEQAYQEYYETVYEGTKTYNDWLKSIKQTKKNSIYMEQAMIALEEKTRGFIVSVNESQGVMASMSTAWNELSLKLSDTGAITTIVKVFKVFVGLIEYTVTNLNDLRLSWIAFNNMMSDNKMLTNSADDIHIFGSELSKLKKKLEENEKVLANWKGLKTEDDVENLYKNLEYLNSIKKAFKEIKNNPIPDSFKNLNLLLNNMPKDIKLNFKIEGDPEKNIKEIDKTIEHLIEKSSMKIKNPVLSLDFLKNISLLKKGAEGMDTLFGSSIRGSLINYNKEMDKHYRLLADISNLYKEYANQPNTIAEQAREYNILGKAVSDTTDKIKLSGVSINKEQAGKLSALSNEIEMISLVNHRYELSKGLAKDMYMYNKNIGVKDEEIDKSSKLIDKLSKSTFGFTTEQIANKAVMLQSLVTDKKKQEGLKKIIDFATKNGRTLLDVNDLIGKSTVGVSDILVDSNKVVSDSFKETNFLTDKSRKYFEELNSQGKTSYDQLANTISVTTPIIRKYLGDLVPVKKISASLEVLRAETGMTVKQLSTILSDVLKANDQAPKIGEKWINIIDLLKLKLLEVQDGTKKTGTKLKDMTLDWYTIVKKAYSMQLNPADKLYESARFEYENNLKLIDEYIAKTKEANKGFMSKEEYDKTREFFKMAYDEQIKLLKLKDLSPKDLEIKYNLELDSINNENFIEDFDNAIKDSLSNIKDYGLESTNIMRFLSQTLRELGSDDLKFDPDFTSLNMFNKEIGATHKNVANVFKVINDLKKGTKNVYDIKLKESITEINKKWDDETKTIKDNAIAITNQYNTARTTLGLNAEWTKAIAKRKDVLDEQIKVLENSRQAEIKLAKERNLLDYINEVKESVASLFSRGKELNLEKAIDSLNEYIDTKQKLFSTKDYTTQFAQDEVNSWELFNSSMWDEASIYKKGSELFNKIGWSMVSDLKSLNDVKDSIVSDGSKFSLLDGWAKGLTPEKIKYIKEALSGINETAKIEMDKTVGLLKDSGQQIADAWKNIGQDIASSLASFFGDQLFSLISDVTKLDLSTKLNADLAELDKARADGLITQEEYLENSRKLQEDHEFKLKQNAQQAKRDALIALGSLFFNKGLGYLIEAPAIAFGGMNGLGNPVAASIYAGTGVGLMALGGALGAMGASVAVPQQGSAVSSTKRLGDTAGSDINLYLYNEVYHDRRNMDRVMNTVTSKNSTINYGG